MKALKAAVIGMAVLLALGFGFVVFTILQRLSGEDAPPLRGDMTLPAAGDCRLADAWNADGLLYLRLEGPRACEAVVLVDPAAQREVGRIQLDRTPQ